MTPEGAIFLLFLAFTMVVLAVLLSALWLARIVANRRRRQSARPLFVVDPETGRPRAATEADGSNIDRSFERLVGDTGLPVTPLQIVLLSTFFATAAGGSALLWFDSVASGLIGAFAVFLLVVPALRVQRSRNLVKLRESLPPALDLIARACRSGESLDQAIELVGEQAPAPWGPQFRICNLQLLSGLSIQAAFDAMWKRTRIEEIRDLQVVLSVHRQTGGNLAAMLDKLAANARDRLEFQRQFRSATSGSRFASGVMTVMFAAVLGVLFLFDDTYANGYFGRPEGIVVTGIGFGLLVVGLVWIDRILRVDY